MSLTPRKDRLMSVVSEGPPTLPRNARLSSRPMEKRNPPAVTCTFWSSGIGYNVAWNVPSQGTSGVGTASALTGDTGTFWFFSPDNLELILKVLDGRAINSHFWVFYGALSDVEYTITVTDTQTGAVRNYHNPYRTLASFADTSAF